MIQENTVTNVVVWDGNTNTWTPPADSIQLVQATTPALVWQGNTLVLVGQNIQSGNNVYTVAISGTTSSVAPVHRFNTVANGTAALKYVGTVPTGTVSVSGGIVTGITLFGMVRNVEMLSGGSGYTSAPTITILGDGVGATAHAVVSGGSIKSIVVDNAGSGYTSAIATITPVEGDSTGQLGAATVNLQGRYGTLRTYYNDNQNVKTIFDSDIGTIDYTKGIITLNSFSPYNVNNPLGQLAVGAKPQTSIISSTYNSIITIDPYDPNAITVNVIAKV